MVLGIALMDVVENLFVKACASEDAAQDHDSQYSLHVPIIGRLSPPDNVSFLTAGECHIIPKNI